MMYSFSQQSLKRAGNRSMLLSTLPFFSSYLDANVKKEVDKDRLIIETAAREFAAGRPVCDLDLEDIFDKTKEIDKTFLNNLIIPSLSFHVRYSEFADIRIQRIWLISKMVYTLLAKWPDTASFDDAVKTAYSDKRFKERLADILHLYNEETLILSKSIRLFGPLNKVVGSYAEIMYQAMEEITDAITGHYAKKIYGDETVYA